MIQHFLKSYIRRSPRSVEKRVVWLVRHAWENVSFYRDLMEDNGINPDDIQSLKDFVERFPRTSASEYRALQQSNGEEYLLDRNLEVSNLIKKGSSGSSGISIFIYKTPAEKEYCSATALWHLVQAGLRPWHRSLAILAPAGMHENKFLLQRFGFFRRTAVHFLMPLEEIIHIIERDKINVIYGHKSIIRLIAEYYDKEGKPAPSLDLLIPGAERVHEYERQFFKEIFSPNKLREFYGATETYLIASKHDTDYQVDYNSCFFALSNPQEQEEHLTTGAMVVTSLYNTTQPILNIGLYDQVTVRDYDKLYELKASITAINGRNNDYLALVDGSRLSAATLYISLDCFSFVRQLRIVQEKSGYCTILLKIADSCDENRQLVEEAVAAVLQNRIEYTIDYVDEIPIDPNGKTKTLISHVTE